MRIPKSFKVNGHTWTVRYKWNLHAEDGDKVVGLNLPLSREVLIERSLTKEEREQTFIHEMIHAVFAENHVREVISLDTEEILTAALEQYIWRNFDLRWRKTPKED